jgi:uncharacterized membrane protein YfcA
MSVELGLFNPDGGLQPGIVLWIAGVFFLAGGIKGIVGVGLPTVAIVLLAPTLGLPAAIALLVAPTLVTNIWQALSGGEARSTFRRIWPFLLAAALTVWIGAGALTRVHLGYLMALLGVVLITYSLISLFGLRFSVRPGLERPVGIAAGLLNGVVTGMTGSFVMPGLIYLQALGLTRTQLIQAMGMLFSSSSVTLSLALADRGIMTGALGIGSVIGLVPALIGLALGQRIRNRLPEKTFRRAFFGALLAAGALILVRSIG